MMFYVVVLCLFCLFVYYDMTNRVLHYYYFNKLKT